MCFGIKKEAVLQSIHSTRRTSCFLNLIMSVKRTHTTGSDEDSSSVSIYERSRSQLPAFPEEIAPVPVVPAAVGAAAASKFVAGSSSLDSPPPEKKQRSGTETPIKKKRPSAPRKPRKPKEQKQQQQQQQPAPHPYKFSFPALFSVGTFNRLKIKNVKRNYFLYNLAASLCAGINDTTDETIISKKIKPISADTIQIFVEDPHKHLPECIRKEGVIYLNWATDNNQSPFLGLFLSFASVEITPVFGAFEYDKKGDTIKLMVTYDLWKRRNDELTTIYEKQPPYKNFVIDDVDIDSSGCEDLPAFISQMSVMAIVLSPLFDMLTKELVKYNPRPKRSVGGISTEEDETDEDEDEEGLDEYEDVGIDDSELPDEDDEHDYHPSEDEDANGVEDEPEIKEEEEVAAAAVPKSIAKVIEDDDEE